VTEQDKRGSTVYFLGAGASKSIYLELPLAGDLTLDSLSNPMSYVNPVRPTVYECGPLTQFLDSHPNGAALRRKRLEYVLEKLRRVAHPRGLCEGGGFDFRTCLAVISRTDSQQLAVRAKDSAPDLLGRPAVGRRSIKHRSAISQSNLAGARHL
jgi:hypothetical protein